MQAKMWSILAGSLQRELGVWCWKTWNPQGTIDHHWQYIQLHVFCKINVFLLLSWNNEFFILLSLSLKFWSLIILSFSSSLTTLPVGLRIFWLYSLQRSNNLPPKGYSVYDTKLYLMMRLQLWKILGVKSTRCYHYSQVHSELKW